MACALALAPGRGAKFSWRSPCWAGIALLLAWHLHATHMRGGPLALLAGIALLVVFSAVRRFVKSPARAAVTTLALVLIAGFVFAGLALARILPADDPGEPVQIDGSLVLRANGYSSASKMVLDSPFLGAGPGNYALENPRYWTAFEQQWYASEGRRNIHVHSDILETAIETGLPGAALHLALLVWALLSALHLAAAGASPSRRRLGATIALCLAIFAVDGAIGFNLRVPVSAGFFFLLLGVLDGLRGPGAPPKFAKTAACGVLGAACASAILMTWAFLAEQDYQFGRGALVAEQHHRAQGDPARADHARGRAQKNFERGGARLPWDARFQTALGGIAASQRDYAAAARYQEAAVARDPHLPRKRIDLARTYAGLAGEMLEGGPAEAAPAAEALAAAESHAQYALDLCGAHPGAHDALGRAAFLRGVWAAKTGQPAQPHWRAAEAHFVQALRRGSGKNAAMRRMLAQVYANTGQLEAAQRAIEAALNIDPGDESAWRLHQAFSRMQNDAPAYTGALKRQLRRARAQGPQGAATAGLIAIYLAESGGLGPEAVEAMLEEILPLNPPQLRLWSFYAATLDAQARLEALQRQIEALPGPAPNPVLAALRDLSPADAATYSAAGDALVMALRAARSEADKARAGQDLSWAAVLVREAEQSATLEDSVRGALLASLAEVFFAAGQWPDAGAALSEAVPLLSGPRLGQAYLLESKTLLAQNRTAAALDAAREAVTYNGGSIQVRWHYVKLLERAGQPSRAKLQYIEILNLPIRDAALRREIEQAHEALLQRMGARP